MTHAQKLEKYKAGQYTMHAPPVCTEYWDQSDWIKYIDYCNGWL